MPHPKRIDRAAIVSAAIEVLDERGLDALSLRTIAARLGVRQPALYRHVDSKVDLLADVAAEVLDRWHTDRLPRDQEPWQDFLVRNARSLRRAMLSVRDGARLIATGGPRSPNVDNSIAQVALLERSGFAGPDAILVFIAVSRYTIGAALEQQTARDGTSINLPAERTDKDALHLAKLAADVAVLGPDHEFEAGLDALVRGFGQSLDTPTA
ncbi:TetR/AcrR family transcriptional regulator, tetracycline repressor protein [Actinopolymorpha cephalotaxi]|uniref:TetR/AcrR family tetracycline transcriptional repressor n=1 Tax=Actinopolymorpha cephalotaxi TaxID=504797 RepID=A0A1I2RCC0_9ACTN|nr:TetR/AcrR family transcriptional regulator C-terminal domain-containing protein [Actinopolymorpha cephalotaxi]NYH82293.1 TetR/AcrR family tetracycline transcriptional repressor [Actinopolymorpha cephalotaxi]SFG37703.1 TetR/AcrR family transcriptional regulator, tetracycline repressor protein [Actinopolymorpha cephalotaxi]